MKEIFPIHYTGFHCLAGDCPDTCCAGWEIVIDAEHEALYRSTDGAIGTRLKKALCYDADGDLIFKNEHGRCPFLNPDLLCDLYTALGESSLSDTCRTYPRWSYNYGAFMTKGLSFSCPEVVKLFMADSSSVPFTTH